MCLEMISYEKNKNRIDYLFPYNLHFIHVFCLLWPSEIKFDEF